MKPVTIIFQDQEYRIDSDFAAQARITDGYIVTTETELVSILAMETRYLNRLDSGLQQAA